MNCEWVKANVSLYVYEELPDDARYELEQHVGRCAGCAAEVKAMRGLRDVMSVAPVEEPTPNLLAASRMRLQEALETTQQAAGWRRFVFEPALWLRQVRFAPALAAVILMIGFAGGVGATYKVLSGRTPTEVVRNAPAAVAEGAVAGIQSITQEPGTNKVQIKYDTLVPQSAQGTLDDQRIQQLLLYAARSNYNSGVRMDSIDLLTKKPQEERIREVLKFSLRYDSNPGVRIKALDALGPYVVSDISVRDAVLEALLNDSNRGVRAEALRTLRPVRADASVRRELEHLSKYDTDKYIRTESKAMLANMPEIE
jgi:hypothetical protein